jgi:hypothetical protein
MLLPIEFRLVRMYLSSESITVNTEMMAKIPMVIPSSDKNVRSLFAFREPKANEKLSYISLIRSIFYEIKYGIKIVFVLIESSQMPNIPF